MNIVRQYRHEPVTVHVLNTVTNETREYKDFLAIDDAELALEPTNELNSALFIWQEGNYSCDCNRDIFFRRAHGDLDAPSRDIHCGEGKFKVRICLDSDGKCVYDEIGQ